MSDPLSSLFLDEISFSQEVELMVVEGEAEDHINAILYCIEKHSIELDEVGKFLSVSLKEKLFSDASRLRMIKNRFKQGELPI